MNSENKVTGIFATEDGTDLTAHISKGKIETLVCFQIGEKEINFGFDNYYLSSIVEGLEFVAKTLSKHIPDKRSTFEKEWDKLTSKLVSIATDEQKKSMEKDVEGLRKSEQFNNIINEIVEGFIATMGIDKIGNFNLAKHLEEAINKL